MEWIRANPVCIVAFSNGGMWQIIGRSTSRSAGADMTYFVEFIADRHTLPAYDESVTRYREAQREAYREWNRATEICGWYEERFYYRQRDAIGFAERETALRPPPVTCRYLSEKS